MTRLTAKEALSRHVVTVSAESRPADILESARAQEAAYCAVFDEETFRGLVKLQDVLSFSSQRIFADLLPERQPPGVSEEAPVEEITRQMEEWGVDALPVFNRQGAFVGIVSHESLIEALLQRKQALLEETERMKAVIEADRHRLAERTERLEQLHIASKDLLSLLASFAVEDTLLQKGIEALARLVQARYGAVAVLDEQGALVQFVHTGLTPEEAQRIGDLPQGHGLLGAIIKENQAIRLVDLTQDPRHWGFPPDHPKMKTLLGVPIASRGRVYGRVYLTERADGQWFTAEDEVLAISFANSLALAIENARLFEQTLASEAQYRSILDIAADAVVSVDEAQRIAVFNQGAEQIFGYTASEVIGQPLDLLLPPRFVEVHRQHIRDFAAAPEGARRMGERREVFGQRKDGTAFPAEASISKLTQDGKTTFTVILRDITERKRATQALRESEDRYRDLVEHSQDLICTHDLEGRILSVNRATVKLLGYDPTEYVEKKNIRDILAPEVRAQFDTYLATIRKEGAANGLMVVQTSTRERRIWEYNNTLRTEGVATPVVRGLAHDITERWRAEKALRESEEKYRTILENIEDGYYEVDLAGNFTFFNDSLGELLGYPEDELIGMNDRQYTDPENAKKLYHTFNQVYRTGEPAQGFDWEIIRKDGTKRFVEASVSLIKDAGGQPCGFRGIVRDTTERKRAEEQITASLKEKEVLLQEIHHRVKNNLQIISSLLSLQAQYTKDQQIGEMFKECQNRVKSMALIHEKLYQSKDLARIDFAEYVRHLAAHLFRSYGVNANAITLRINVDDVFLDVDTAIPCGLIINELVSNSLKHAFPSGQPGEIRIGLRAGQDHQLTLTVSDNGAGFPKEVDFRNSDSLGLRLVVALVNQCQGTIELHRQSGTAFRIMLQSQEGS